MNQGHPARPEIKNGGGGDATGGPLCHALGVDNPGQVAVVGSGGKTSLLAALAAELARGGRPVVVSTTTRIYPPQAGQGGLWTPTAGEFSLAGLERRLKAGAPLYLTSPPDARGKLPPPPPEVLDTLCTRPGLYLLLEADGAAGRPLKGWAPWEPVVPEDACLLVVVAGMSGLGRPLHPRWVHRPERFAAAAGLRPGEEITPPALARVLAGPAGPLKARPAKARTALVLSQAQEAPPPRLARLAGLLRPDFTRVLAARLGWRRLEPL